VRQRERTHHRFKSPDSGQRFLNIQSAVYNTFYYSADPRLSSCGLTHSTNCSTRD
jgi:hypothetical protein